jgi:hypothetical protein
MYSYFPENAKKIFSSKGKDIIQEIGLDIIKGVVFDVLTGKNLRDSTELLTRKRVVTLNAATLTMMVKGTAQDPDFVKKIPNQAYNKLVGGKLKKEERWLMQWMLGLTDKAFQNVLRDDSSSLKKYKDDYIKITQKIIKEFKKDYGDLGGVIKLDQREKVMIDWDFMVQLMSTIGSQTLAIRGSDKSTFGKLFEKLILGSLLSVLGFKIVDQNNITETKNVFWLSSRAEKRESDATLLYRPGKGIRFDIGFIGRGNPEISLDKVSRFEREIELGRQKWYMRTIIIVDRIGANSGIEKLAKNINGNIVQMSGAYWPVHIARILKETYGYTNPILKMTPEKVDSYIKLKLQIINFEKILNLPAFTENLKAE